MTVVQTYVAGIRADGELQYQARSGRSVRFQPLHMPQSPLDRACGVHALLTAFALVTRTPRSTLEGLADRSRGQWQAFWSHARSLYFSGATPKDLDICASVLNDISTHVVRTDTEDKLFKVCASAIEKGAVPLLDLHGPSLAHWSVCLGVELRSGKPSALLCLDASAGAPWAAHTNARFDLAHVKKPVKGRPLHVYRDTDGRRKFARVRSVLLVMPVERPP